VSFNGPLLVQLVDGAIPITTTVVGPKTALDVAISKDTTVSNPSIFNVSMPIANTEYSVSIPAFTKEFAMKTRDGGLLQFAYISGDSGTYISVAAGTVFSKTNIYSSSTITIYFQSSKINTLELMTWS
jgi:hypothetical protein